LELEKAFVIGLNVIISCVELYKGPLKITEAYVKKLNCYELKLKI